MTSPVQLLEMPSDLGSDVEDDGARTEETLREARPQKRKVSAACAQGF